MAATTEQRPLSGFDLLEEYLTWRAGTFAVQVPAADRAGSAAARS